jgi:hypothetical protein
MTRNIGAELVARLKHMNDILADYREWSDQQDARVSTHSDGCHMWHERCMIHRLADALEKATLTDAEREAIRFALKSLDWPLDGPQLAVVARTVGASCEVPEHRMKATLRGLLERMK